MHNYGEARARLIDKLGIEIKDRRVLEAMSRVPREMFVLQELRDQAYEDIPLPIGHEQTISQPYIIALMTQELEIKSGEKVLEIGTGSGYQTAILAELAGQVVTVERFPALADSARSLLDILGYSNIEFHLAGEKLGWKEGAPYDAILVTAGAPNIPEDLIEQLVVGGRMVIPVGTRHIQELCKIVKRLRNNIVQRLGGCRFVSLIGKNAWQN
ncbi:MAG: protein-L-isoaspartate O-methyltransferase [Chloroflexi bacterium RBG_16_58_8]|nr:MAG: protein-L-isoaspartate O-methyltransferase [Chloroflexi bacterium RBG_16_58_8]